MDENKLDDLNRRLEKYEERIKAIENQRITQGQILPAVVKERHIGDGEVSHQKLNFSGARLYSSSTQDAINNNITALSFWDSANFDTGNYHDSSSPSRLTISEDGYYLIGGTVFFLSWSSNNNAQTFFRRNGSGQIVWLGRSGYAFGSASSLVHNGSTIVYAAAGDYFELCILQTSGVDKTIWGNNLDSASTFWITRLA